MTLSKRFGQEKWEVGWGHEGKEIRKKKTREELGRTFQQEETGSEKSPRQKHSARDQRPEKPKSLAGPRGERMQHAETHRRSRVQIRQGLTDLQPIVHPEHEENVGKN